MFARFILMIATVMQLGSFVEATTAAPTYIDEIYDPTVVWLETTIPESRAWQISAVCPGGKLIRSFDLGSPPDSTKTLQQGPSTHAPNKPMSAIKLTCHPEPGKDLDKAGMFIGDFVEHDFDDDSECLDGSFTGYALQTPFTKADTSAKKMTPQVTNVKMMCSNEDDTEMIGFPTNQGDWTPYAYCNTGDGVCGFKIIARKVKGRHILQNVAIKCCLDLNVIRTGGRRARSGHSGPSKKLFGPLTILLCFGVIFAKRYFN